MRGSGGANATVHGVTAARRARLRRWLRPFARRKNPSVQNQGPGTRASDVSNRTSSATLPASLPVRRSGSSVPGASLTTR